jgi:hypothetical protein
MAQKMYAHMNKEKSKCVLEEQVARGWTGDVSKFPYWKKSH